ncbi:MAG: SDR family oxidoreductase [Chloroflexia bacterium]|nr:SDR family oxidoreductase [Chloroflexia bacterium]
MQEAGSKRKEAGGRKQEERGKREKAGGRRQETEGRYVVITGTSSGIGRACALELDRRGWYVLAGVRREEDGAALQERASARLQPLLLDVTEAESIAAAVRVVGQAAGELGLAGLVNNAGIAVAGPLESVSPAALQRQLQVNVVGPVAVTQALLPLLRRARGRIVNIGSISGRLTTPMTGPYCASKAALEAVTAALRMELRPWGIHVAMVSPGIVDTPILDRSVEASAERIQDLSGPVREFYGPIVASLKQKTGRLFRAATSTERVARAVTRALTASRPRSRYVVGWDARLVELLRSIPEQLREYLILRQMGLTRTCEDPMGHY